MLNIQNYKRVESIEEAYELNQKKANRIVGGMMWMRMGDNTAKKSVRLQESRSLIPLQKQNRLDRKAVWMRW